MLIDNCLNIRGFDKEYIYLGEYNTLMAKTDMLEDILKRFSIYSDQQIIDQLASSYPKESLENQILILRNWFIDIDDHKKRINQLYDTTENEWFGKKALSSLLINISHDCNLRCIYCYGDGGDYGKSRKLMTLEKAKEVIDYWLKYLNLEEEKISVVFFGGEPLMNKKVLIFAVNYINEELSRVNRSANYSVTTNGTILDKEILELLVRNRFSVTLSIDGGKEVQNRNRPTISGRGSFDDLQKNIIRLRQYYKWISARITLTHENVGNFSESVKEIWNLGISRIMYDIVSTTNNSLRITEEDVEIIDRQLDELSEITYQSMISGGERILKPLVKIGREMHGKMFTPGCVYDSRKILSVDVDGILFKCQRLSGDSSFNVGDIMSGLDWEKYQKQAKLVCSDCWANNLCHKCAQANYVYNNDPIVPDHVWCEHRKMQIIKSIELYIRIFNSHPSMVREIYSNY